MRTFRSALSTLFLAVIVLVMGLAVSCSGGGGGGNPPTPAADFSLSVVAASNIQAGSNGTTTVNVMRTNGHIAAITLSLAANSQGITGSGAIASGAASGTLTLTVPSGVSPSTYTLTTNGNDGSLTRSSGFSLTVTPSSPDFSLSVVAPPSIQVGNTSTTTVNVTRMNGHTAPITLSLATNTQAITGSGTIASGAASGTLTVTVPGSAAPSTYSLTLNGSDGTLDRSGLFNLTVIPRSTATLAISPVGANVAPGSAVRLTAYTTNANGAPNPTWSIQEVGQGSLNVAPDYLSANYTTPSTLGPYHIVVSIDSLGLRAAAEIKVVSADDAAFLSLQTSPYKMNVQPAQVVQGRAKSRGKKEVLPPPPGEGSFALVDASVVWSLAEGSLAGTVNPNTGDYTSASRPGVYHLIATSLENPRVQGSIEVSVDSATTPPPQLISMRPRVAYLEPLDQAYLRALAIGVASATVNWSLLEGSSGGTLSTPTGGADNEIQYTAPSGGGDFHILATSASNPTVQGVTTIHVASRVNLTVAPALTQVPPGASVDLTATVTGSNLTDVIWGSSDPVGGILSPNGNTAHYTAPTTPGIYYVSVRPKADPEKQAQALIQVTGSATVSVKLLDVPTKIQLISQVQMVAQVLGASDTSVTWSTSAGTIAGTGLLSVPGSAGPVTVTATSVADSSKKDMVTIQVGNVPVFTSVPPILTNPTAMFTYTPTTSHPDALATTLALEYGPTGATFSGGVLSWLPSPDQWALENTFELSATDSQGGVTTQRWTEAFAPQVILNPSGPSLQPNGTVLFSVSVVGNANQNVTWTVIPGTATGAIPVGPSTTALFTAGPTAGTCQVKATSVADSNKFATAIVAILAPTGLVLSPSVLSIAPGTTQQFGALLNGVPTSGVAWSLMEGAVAGTISASGFYTAGSTIGTYHVQAVTTSGPTESATAQVTVATTVSIQILPGTLTLGGGDTGNFNAQLDPNGILRDVTWAIQEGAAGGSYTTDNGSMVYFPPIVATPTLFHVIVTSVADPTKSSTSAVTVNPPPAGGISFSAAPQSMASRRQQFTATPLADGRIFICGGTYDTPGNAAFADPQEIFDPAALAFTPVAGTLIHGRTFHTATLMGNGKVLISGGATGYEDPDRASAEVFDPTTGQFTATVNLMSIIRGAGHQSVPLTTGPNAGKVLVLGGAGYFYSTDATTSADLYDPATNQFTAIPTGMNDARSFFTATKLQDGKILLVGGIKNNTEQQLATAEIFDPGTLIFTRTAGNMSTARFLHTATLLNNGKVLITGGLGAYDGHLELAELFDPVSGTFTQITAPMAVARYYHSATLMGNGQVLVTGGKDRGSYVYRTCGSAEIYDPGTNTWFSAGRMGTAREEHATVLLGSGPSSGKVLVLGGSNGNAKNSAEIFN